MNFLHLSFLQLRKHNYMKCQDFFSRATYFFSGCNESCCSLRREILPGCAGAPALLHAPVSKHGHDWKRGFEGMQLPTLVSALLFPLTLALVLRWISSLLPTEQIYSEMQIYRNIYKYLVIFLYFRLLGERKDHFIRVGYWACSQSHSGLQQWWWCWKKVLFS